MFEKLVEINARPEPFEFYTAEELWTDEYTSRMMLDFHLNEDVDLSSRRRSFIDRSVVWIIDRFHLDTAKSVADFGCGPGLYTTPFAETGARVTGIDFSSTSLEYAGQVAAEKGLSIEYIRENYLDFETDARYDLITMIFCDLCALSPAQRETLLLKFYRFLKPGGSLLLDVHSVNTFENREESATYERNQLGGFWSADDYYGFLNTFKYDREKVTLDKYTIVEAARTRVVYNWLQYFTRDSIKAELETAGFEVEQVYSDVAGTPFDPSSADMAVVAIRR